MTDKIRRWRTAAFGCLLASFNASGNQSPLPTEDFARHAAYEQVRISPDGKYLAVAVPIEESTGLAVLRVEDMKLTASLNMGHQEHVQDFWWTSRDRVLVSRARSGGRRGNKRSTGELLSIDADGSGSRYLFGYRGADQTGSHLRKATKVRASATVIDPLVNDPNWAMIAVRFWETRAGEAYQRIEKINVHSGFRAQIDTAPIDGSPRFLTDHQGELRYVTGEDQELQQRTYYRAPGADKWTELGTGHARDTNALAFARDGSRAYLGIRNNSGIRCLYEHDITADQYRELLCQDESDLASVTMSFDGQQPIGASFYGGKQQLVLAGSHHPDEQVLKAILAGFRGQRVQVVSKTQNGNTLVLKVSSDRNPGDYYLFDTAKRSASYLISSRPWIDPETQAERRPFTITSDNSPGLSGYITLPANKPHKRLPMIVLPHGGPLDVRDDWNWDALPQFLAHHGYAVLQVNFRGSRGHGLAFEQSGYRAWGTGMIDDITRATRWAIKSGLADKDRICISGGSYGAYASMMSAIRAPELFQCVGGYVGVYDLVGIGEDNDSSNGSRWSTHELERIGDEATRRAQSPMLMLDKLRAPMLIVHGGLDRRAPLRHATDLRDALKKRDHPHEWLLKSTEGHGFFKLDNRVEYFDTLLAFINSHIGSARP